MSESYEILLTKVHEARANLPLALELHALSEPHRPTPDDPRSPFVLGTVYMAHRKYLEALAAFLEAERLKLESFVGVDTYQMYSDIGVCYFYQHDFFNARKYLKKSIKLNPNNFRTRFNLGLAYHRLLDFKSAHYHLRRAAREYPCAEHYAQVGGNFLMWDKPKQAIRFYNMALAFEPDNPKIVVDKAQALMNIGDFGRAYKTIKPFARSDLESDFIAPLFKIFQKLNDYEAIEALGDRYAAYERTNPIAIQTAIINELPLLSQANYHRLVTRWNELLKKDRPPVPNISPSGPKGPTNKLRVGLMGGDFRNHAVMTFLLPYLQNKGPDIDYFAFSSNAHRDAVTEATASLVTEFHQIQEMDTVSLVKMLRDKHLDVMIDLAGHTNFGRLNVLIDRVAPKQIHWLGFPQPLGAGFLDGFVTDKYMWPDDITPLPSEKPLYHEWGAYCFHPNVESKIWEGIGCKRDVYGGISFGTQNAPYKYTPATIALWARVLRENPRSRFIIARPEMVSKDLRTNIVKQFAAGGVEEERIYFSKTTHGHHLALYNFMDITLDTIGLSGGTTTVEALCMGAPVVSLRGEAMHGRLSYAFLKHLDLPWCADSEDQYVEIATNLASSPEHLEYYRHNLRGHIANFGVAQPQQWAPKFEILLKDLTSS